LAKYNKRFGSDREDWETPDELFIPLKHEFDIEIDVCASNQNKKCVLFFSKADDAFSKDWSKFNACWMNPPFGQNGKWIKKAYHESRRGALVVCLVPARTNTNWWHDYATLGEIRFIKGRPQFKGAPGGLPQPLAIVIFRPPNQALETDGRKDGLRSA